MSGDGSSQKNAFWISIRTKVPIPRIHFDELLGIVLLALERGLLEYAGYHPCCKLRISKTFFCVKGRSSKW